MLEKLTTAIGTLASRVALSAPVARRLPAADFNSAITAKDWPSIGLAIVVVT